MANSKTVWRRCYKCKEITKHVDTESKDSKGKKIGIDSVCAKCGAPSFYPVIFIV